MSSQLFYDVTIISAYNRGVWLAQEIKSLGLKVALIDVTKYLGRWSPEDVEGPFGLFHSSTISRSQMARLDAETHTESVDDGLTVLLPTGPIDMRGSHSQYLLEKNHVPIEVIQLVYNSGTYPEKKWKEAIKQINTYKFTQRWLATLAQYLASTVDQPYYEKLSLRPLLQIADPISLRRVSRRGNEKLLGWIKDLGVDVYEGSKLRDASVDALTLKHVEVESESGWSGVIPSEKFIWTLSSAESQFLDPAIAFQIFNKQKLTHNWSWLRFRMTLKSDSIRQLPLQMWVISDPSLSWTHENLIGMQKTTSENQFDFWVMVPENMRYQKSYLEEILKKIQNSIQAHIPDLEVLKTELPQEYNYDEKSLGPSCYGKYDFDEMNRFQPNSFKNVYFDGPECWGSLDWTGQFIYQSQLAEKLKNWMDEREKAKLKETMKDREHDR